MPCLEQTSAIMILHLSLSSVIHSKAMLLEPSILPVRDKNSSPLWRHIWLLNIVVEESEKLGLSLNVKKTECMVVSKKKNNPECKLFSKGEQIRQVQKFKYLGYTLTSDGKCRTEIKKRIALAKASFQKMSTILKIRNISFSTKLKVLKTYVWSILLYGCETWTITAGTKKNVEAAEM